MRMFLLFVLLLIPLPLMANTPLSVCSAYNQESDLCNVTAGCHYDNGQCGQCPETKYCPSDKTDPQPCPTTPSFPKSQLGATSINECYKDLECHKPDGEIELCKLYYNDTIECNTIEETHLDPRTNTCYANTRNCNVFGAENCASDQISGIATYLSQGTGGSMGDVHHWDITDCVCNASDFEDTQERLCHGKSPAIPSEQTVQNVDSIINYNTSTGMYYCTRCIRDNGNTKYYANTTASDGTQCSPDPDNGRVCKCETSNELGYYRSGTCNSETDWAQDGNNICQRVACSAGQTTNTILPNSVNDCHFGGETNLCDDAGCISLDGLGGVSAQNWEYVQ